MTRRMRSFPLGSAAVLLGALALLLPYAGGYALWDPWEPHYAEVARQVLLRGDWLTLYWPGSPIDTAEFFSKPPLIFWLEAASMRLFGLGGAAAPPDQMALSSTAEWAVRLPAMGLGALGAWATFAVTARLAGRRAGFLSALVLGTCPLWFLHSRQATTDAPFVALLTTAVALAAIALGDDGEQDPLARLAPLRWGLGAMALLAVVPQLVAATPALGLELAPELALAGLLAWRVVVMRRRADALFVAAGLAAGLATLAKGPLGLLLPALALVAWLSLGGAWRRVARVDVLGSAIAFLATALPWYHGVIALHGPGFIDEFFGDTYLARFLGDSQYGIRGDFSFYAGTLAVGFFPWSAAAIAAAPWAARAAGRSDPRRSLVLLAVCWATVCFVLVALSGAKFHHYVLPAVPPIAILVGCYLDDLLAGALPPAAAAGPLLLAGVPLAGTVLHGLVSRPQGPQAFLWLFDYDYVMSPKGLPWPSGIDVGYVYFGLGMVALGATALLAIAPTRRLAFCALATAAAVSAVFTIDSLLPRLAPHWSDKALMATYFRERRGGERLAFFHLYDRGDTFYSQNAPHDPGLPPRDRAVFMQSADAQLGRWLALRPPGERVFVATWRTQLEALRQALPAKSRETVRVADDTSNKLILVSLRTPAAPP
jgi:4-amino-4-deoxy-L-arabinose transferase-like glycosyltransferase